MSRVSDNPCRYCQATDWAVGKMVTICKNCGATIEDDTHWDRETIPEFAWGWKDNVEWVKGIKKQVLR